MAKILLWMVLGGCFVGCTVDAGPGVTSRPGPSTRPGSTEQASYDALWQACLRVLRDYQFRIDRIDRREGLITTFPMTGMSWFELARKDAATAHDALESSLQTIYRTAEVRIARGQGDLYRPKVRIAVSRAYRPGAQITSTGEAYDLFLVPSGRRRTLRDGLTAKAPADVAELPDDEKLAAKIEADIEERLNEVRAP